MLLDPPGIEVTPRRLQAAREAAVRAMPAVVRRLMAISAHDVLEVGCGNGWLSVGLDRCGFRVTGLGPDEELMTLTARRYPQLQWIAHELGDPIQPELRGRFDAVVVFEPLDLALGPAGLLHLLRSVLRPGGLVSLTLPPPVGLRERVQSVTTRWQRGQPGSEADASDTWAGWLVDHGLRDVHCEAIGRVPAWPRALLVTARLPG